MFHPQYKNIDTEDIVVDTNEDDYYDERGRPSPGGLYDVGGHPIPDRWADFADYINNRDR